MKNLFINKCLCYLNNNNPLNNNTVIKVQSGFKCKMNHIGKAIIAFSFENEIRTEIYERILIICVENCAECNGDATCNKCKTGYVLAISNNQKIYLLSTTTNGYYQDTTDNIYKECYSTCKTCRSNYKCDSCKEGAKLDYYTCVFPYTCSNSSKMLKSGKEIIISPSLNGVTSFHC